MIIIRVNVMRRGMDPHLEWEVGVTKERLVCFEAAKNVMGLPAEATRGVLCVSDIPPPGGKFAGIRPDKWEGRKSNYSFWHVVGEDGTSYGVFGGRPRCLYESFRNLINTVSDLCDCRTVYAWAEDVS